MYKNYLQPIVTIFMCVAPLVSSSISACTRVVYQGVNGTIITARSMDWKGDIPDNLWVFPRSMQRTGEAGTTSVKWKSKYGSVITSSWDIASSDGMNEKVLVGNLLWLVEFSKIDFSEKGKVRKLSLANNENYSGKCSSKFAVNTPFQFAPLK